MSLKLPLLVLVLILIIYDHVLLVTTSTSVTVTAKCFTLLPCWLLIKGTSSLIRGSGGLISGLMLLIIGSRSDFYQTARLHVLLSLVHLVPRGCSYHRGCFRGRGGDGHDLFGDEIASIGSKLDHLADRGGW